jgi:hypothetical protein
MSLIATAGSESTFRPVPEGTHLARCYRIVDLGTQESTYLGQVKNQRKVMIQFEVHGDDENGFALITRAGEPMSISKNYTLSIGEKSRLRQDLASWRGKAFTPEELKGFELKNLLGVWGMISVIKTLGSDGKEYSNINAITPVPAVVKKSGMPQYFNDPKIFSIDSPDMELFATFSDYLRAKIEGSPEWKKRNNLSSYTGGGVEELDEDIPF